MFTPEIIMYPHALMWLKYPPTAPTRIFGWTHISTLSSFGQPSKLPITHFCDQDNKGKRELPTSVLWYPTILPPRNHASPTTQHLRPYNIIAMLCHSITRPHAPLEEYLVDMMASAKVVDEVLQWKGWVIYSYTLAMRGCVEGEEVQDKYQEQ